MGATRSNLDSEPETAASAILLAQMRCEIPIMARKRKSRTRKTTTEDGLPDDLYDYARPPARRVAGRRRRIRPPGPSPMTGPTRCRSPRPRSRCSRPGSATCSMSCSRPATDFGLWRICHDRAHSCRPLPAGLDQPSGRERPLDPGPAPAGQGRTAPHTAGRSWPTMSSPARPPPTTGDRSSSA